MKLLSRISRISAWVLLFAFAVFVLSGLDVLGRLFSPQVMSFIHIKYLFFVAEPAFAFHVTYAINKAFKRWNWPTVLRRGMVALFLLINVALSAYFIYVQFLMR